ncbi:MAG TPA: isopentenyl-diphosphate Delta-isomerase [Mariniphaga sp.]|nr:isopentenyl-diphosphate Delta-isomerase [Mariniphaga sp.]
MNNPDNQLVILVDANNTETGTMEKLEAHRQGKLHRAISVFICNTKGEWLLQRRALDKYHTAGLWSNTCCSHPYPGESSKDAATRRLKEEMGITTKLTELFGFLYKASLENEITEHEYDEVFFGITNDLPNINRNEVMDWRYITFHQLEQELEQDKDQFTVWFQKIFRKVHRNVENLIK